MGVVYEGRHPIIGKRVAVKFLLSALSSDKDLVERFKAEARSVNEIGHRGIVDIFDFGVMEDGTQYFVMELLEGRAFDQVIRTEAPLHPAMAVRYLEEIVDALAAAHHAGVIHRDIKPSNVFLVESLRARPYIKLLDFGIAKMNAPKSGSTPQTRQSVVIGTPEYIAPEQAQGRSISAATDLYAVGCMAYEMLTGRLPFRGENPLDTMFKHVTEPTPRASATVPGVPKQLDDLVFQLMQKKPDDRPHTAEEVLKRLEESRGLLTVEAGLPVASPSAPRPPSPAASPHLGDLGEAALANTYQSLPSVKAPAAPNTAAVLATMQKPRGLVGPLVLGALAVVLLAGAWVFTRPPPAPILLEPPPVKIAEVKPPEVDAGTVKVEPPPLGVVVPPLPPLDAGAAKPVTPVVKRGITQAQLMARIASLGRKLEQREATKGEAIKVLRQFLQQAKEQAEQAKTDADRKEVWVFLDEVARQLER